MLAAPGRTCAMTLLAVLIALLPLLAYVPTMPPVDQAAGDMPPCHAMPQHTAHAERPAGCPDCDGPGIGCSCCDHAVPVSVAGALPVFATPHPAARVFRVGPVDALPTPPLTRLDRPPRPLTA